MRLNLKKVYLSEATAERDAEFRQKAKDALEQVKEFLTGPEAHEGNVQYVDKFGGSFVLTPHKLGWEEQYPELFIILAPKNIGFAGGMTKHKATGRRFIVLSIIGEDGLEGAHLKLGAVASIFIHEFIHYLDIKRYGQKKLDSKNFSGAVKREKGEKAYVNTPEEVNAYYQEAAYKVEEFFDILERHKPELLENYFSDFDSFFKKSRKMFTKGFLENLEEKNYKKVLNRLYSLYEMLRKKYKLED